MKNGVGTIQTGLAACALFAFAAPGIFAACPVTVLPSTDDVLTSAPAPTARYSYARSVYLIPQTELATAGVGNGVVLSGIGWNYYNPPGAAASAPLVVYLQNTTDTTNLKSTTWATAITGMTTVHNANTTLPGTAGAFDIPFVGGSTFTYTGGGLYVAFDWGQYTGTLSSTASITCNGNLASGRLYAQTTGSTPPTTLAASSWRPETRFIPGLVNDAGVNLVYAMGGLPVGLTGPSVISAVVSNNGNSPISALPVTLTISGANSFNDTQLVASIAPCATAVVAFAGFSPAAVGSNTVTVSVPPGDDNLGNNTRAKPLDVSAGGYTYKYPGTTASGGLGFAAPGGELCAKFNALIPSHVDAVSVEFSGASATTYRVVVRGDDGAGSPGALLYEDAADRAVGAAGPVTLTLPIPVGVAPGNFFVGLRQTNATNMGLAFDAEDPIRSGAFYYGGAGGPYNDFSPWDNYKLNVGLTLSGCYLPSSVDVTPDSPPSLCPGLDTVFTATPSGGTPPFTYQWTEDGVDIPGATGTTLTVNKAGGGTFTYNCKVGPGAACPTAQDAASPTLTVLGVPAITGQPTSQTACSGTTALYSVGASGAGLTYQWQGSSDFGATFSDLSDGGPYAGTATSTLAVAATPDMHARFFRVYIAGSCPSALTSNSAALAVSGPYSTPVVTGVTPVSACSQSGMQVAYAPAVGAARHDLYADGVTAVSGYASGAVYNPGDALPHSYTVVGVNGTCATSSTPILLADNGQSPAAVGSLALAKAGTSLRFTWAGLPAGTVDSYEVMRGASPQGPFDQRVGSVSGLAAVGADGVLATGLLVDLAGEPAEAYYKVRGVKGACAGPLD